MRLMQTSRLPLRARTLLLAALLLGLTQAARSAQTHATGTPKAASHGPAATNAPPTQPEIPKSVFLIPSSPQEGKDPFFPLSTRLRKTVVVPATNQPAVTVELELKGVSGTAGHRLAIINNRTFGPGEEGEVMTSAGRVRIICKDIGDDSVQVLVNGAERTVRMRAGF